MPKQILSVGNCSYDFGTLSQALEAKFDVALQNAETADEAEQVLKKQQFDLIVVNRLFDINQDSGIALIKKLKEQKLATPMMLISNFPESQEEAVGVGAVPGYGKKAVGKPEMLDLVGQYLK